MNNHKKKMTGKELVAFARSKIGVPYVYGCKGTVLTLANFNYLQNRYGKGAVWDSDRSKVGKVCVDCSGLISWACGVVLGSSQWKDRASVCEPISTIHKAPVGALVWMKGHIGIYTGTKKGVPYYVAADGSAYGVQEVPLNKNKFTHWLLVEDIFAYGNADGNAESKKEDDEMVEKSKVILNDKEESCNRILKDGRNYVDIRDVARMFGCEITSKGSIAVLTKK